MEPISLKIGYNSIEFYGDDTIDSVRQLIALNVDSHPDRLFLEVATTLPGDYYSSNPKNWTDLFLRLARGGDKVSIEALNTYLTQIRPGTGMSPREITKEEWEAHDDDLAPIFKPDIDSFVEWRILGVPLSAILPIPPKEVQLPASLIPIPRSQSLWETLHPYPVTEVRATEIKPETSEIVRMYYFPLFRPDTPNNLESLRTSIERTRGQLTKLISLDAPKHETSAIVKAKWFVPFVTTRIPAPRTRFEQIFYGLTLSEDTPYVGYFTAKTETLRHKFYVEDPKNKKPWIDTSLLRTWIATTTPQRRTPTLLLYRGTSRTSFDRIAITSKDITIDIRREKSSKKELEKLQKHALDWLKTLDAVIPFLDESDIEPSRWQLADMSLVATYSKEITEFDMRRFNCLQSIFSVQDDTFRLLRAEHTSDDVSPRIIQAYQILTQERTPQYLAEEMGIPIAEATQLFAEVSELSAEFDFEKSLKAYPILKFSGKEVIIKFVTNPERMLKYTDILRFVLTSESDSVNDVCPRRLEEVLPKVVVPQQVINVEEEATLDYLDELGLDLEEEQPVSAPQQPKSRKVKLTPKTTATYNYFNSRLQKYDANTFDKSLYPSKCDKPKQVIALTAEDKERIGAEYNYETSPESEKLEITDPEATLICPPYWCMRDEIPLREDQLVEGDRCPVCDGKVRQSDNADPTEFTVIKRDLLAKYPDYSKAISTINKKKMPCCYTQPRSASVVLAAKEDETYVLKQDAGTLPAFRIAYLSEELSEKLLVKTHYETSIKKGRLSTGEGDIFRIGLGRPSRTLPVLFDDKTLIKRPSEAKENVMRCSFYRTWRETREGDILASIDAAYETGSMSILEELEYTTSFLKCEVILIDTKSNQVLCGFWSDTVGANSRTIALLDNDILGFVSRKRQGKSYKTEYNVDLRKSPFGTTIWPTLLDLHKQACSIGVPTLADAITELQRAGKAEYQVILDPFERIQAVFVPGEFILPVLPSNTKPKEGVKVRSGYVDIRDEELPDGRSQRDFLKSCIHPGFKKTRDLQNIDGMIVEFELASGFRVPIQSEEPEDGADYAAEVVETIRKHDEKTLVEGQPNKADIAFAQKTTYTEEIFQFLLYSLSKDVQTEEYGNLRTSISEKRTTLYKDLDKWFKAEAYEDATQSPINFINKVRTPCGQYTNKDSCNKSSLCGWHKNDCKIRVKPIVSKEEVLKRITKVLRENDKQRALVLDDRLSPFFSTILYLEMPHEWITTSF
jgi:hypothetical protein